MVSIRRYFQKKSYKSKRNWSYSLTRESRLPKEPTHLSSLSAWRLPGNMLRVQIVDHLRHLWVFLALKLPHRDLKCMWRTSAGNAVGWVGGGRMLLERKATINLFSRRSDHHYSSSTTWKQNWWSLFIIRLTCQCWAIKSVRVLCRKLGSGKISFFIPWG